MPWVIFIQIGKGETKSGEVFIFQKIIYYDHIFFFHSHRQQGVCISDIKVTLKSNNIATPVRSIGRQNQSMWFNNTAYSYLNCIYKMKLQTLLRCHYSAWEMKQDKGLDQQFSNILSKRIFFPKAKIYDRIQMYE